MEGYGRVPRLLPNVERGVRNEKGGALTIMLSLKSLAINVVKDAPQFVKDSVKP
jgi:hypothetical protein